MDIRGSTRGKCIWSQALTKGVALTSIAAIGLVATGCAVLLFGAGAGAAAVGVTYIKGDLQARVKADPRAVEKASLTAFEVLGIREISSRGSALDAEIVGRTAGDRKVTIKAKAEGMDESSLSIRIGTFGDEPLSRRIYDEISKQLADAIDALKNERTRAAPITCGSRA